MSVDVKYSGYLGSYSGMGEAARNIVMGLKRAGINLATEFVPNLGTSTDLGAAYTVCNDLRNRDIPYNIKIIHITPNDVRSYMEPMKYHIFHLFWETDRLPSWWVWELNHSVDEVWTGSEWNKRIFKQSGVKVPIWVCPQPIEVVHPPVAKKAIPGFSGYLFGTVAQFIERKDFKTLVQAFWKEFEREEGVGLILKTYIEKFTPSETDKMLKILREWKAELGLTRYPNIYLLPDILNKTNMYRFYKTIDCFVSSHRGEGFGIPTGEAMVVGKPVISTDLGGIQEAIPHDYWYPVSYREVKVFNMEWVPWYSDEQNWAQVNEEELRSKMRYVFDHQDEARAKGLRAQGFVQNALNYENIGNRMKDQLEKI